ncbi:MAG: DNA topoisomerase 3 [Desulfovibrionales bacterium]|nr:DNA topoisomerase 3 [Desulfovibrionales bacterium]
MANQGAPLHTKLLIIAEKPSVARELAAVLQVRGRGEGFLHNDSYVITWAVGHLVAIAEPGEQDQQWSGRWSMRQLPMLPARFALRVLPKTAAQYEIIRTFLLDEQINGVINATDAGREGELIFRRMYLLAGATKPIQRLWANDMTEKGLLKAFANLLSGESKRYLGHAAFARAEADWLVGMNFSRLFTLKAGSLITVGRVQTPVLKLLVERRREIEDFVPQDYWTVDALFEHQADQFKATWFAPTEYKESKIQSEADAQAIVDACTGQAGHVLSVDKKKGRQKPPLPFDLTTLQKEANARFNFSAQETLSIAQDLYEKKKLITYPRTDSRYLTQELFSECLEQLRAIHAHFPDISTKAAHNITASKKKFECVNDKKVTDHHAIIPTAMRANPASLHPQQWQLYEMICRRFIAAFMDEVSFSTSTLWVELGAHRFKATGKIFHDIGWLEAEPWRTAEDNPLPPLRKGSAVTVADLALAKHKTKPPAHYTDASLLAAMETAGKLVEDEALREALKERGLGTPATRAQIIETLLSRQYVDKQGKRLIATDLGAWAIDVVCAMIPHVASPEMTGEWEQKLKAMEHGQVPYAQFMQQVRDVVSAGVQRVKTESVRLPPCPAPGRQAQKNLAPESSQEG